MPKIINRETAKQEEWVSEWLNIFRQCRESGLSGPKFCKEHGIDYLTLKYMQRKLNRRGIDARYVSKSPEKSGKTDDEWYEILMDCHKKGISRSQYCRENHLSSSLLDMHKNRLKKLGYDIPESNFKFDNPTRPDDEWYDIIIRCQNSGLSMSEFCRQNGLAKSSFVTARNRLIKNGYDIPPYQT